MQIDKQSPIPIYFQIMEQLKTQIKNGELKADALLPSEREYAEQFGISRMTVRQALSNLVNEGFLYRQKGRGTFVSKLKMEQPLQGLTSFTEDMRSRGMKPGWLPIRRRAWLKKMSLSFRQKRSLSRRRESCPISNDQWRQSADSACDH